VRGPLADGKARLFAQGLAQETPPETEAEEEVAASGVAGSAVDESAAAVKAEPGAEPQRRSVPPRSAASPLAGRRAQRAAAEAECPDTPSGPDGAPDVEALVRLLCEEFAAGGEISQEGAEEFLRNLLRDG
jgi:hypothetical protein